MSRHRFAVVGGGIIGTSVARRLGQLRPDASVTLLEKESELGLSHRGYRADLDPRVTQSGPTTTRNVQLSVCSPTRTSLPWKSQPASGGSRRSRLATLNPPLWSARSQATIVMAAMMPDS